MVLCKGDKDKYVYCLKCGLGLILEELVKYMKVFYECFKCECGVEFEMEVMVRF